MADPNARISQLVTNVLSKSVYPALRVTQTVALSLITDKSKLRVTQVVVLTLVSAQKALYDTVSFTNRVIALFPVSWQNKAALRPGGVFYVFFKAVGTSLAGHKNNQIDYAQRQTRIKTSSGTNVDNISLDFFGLTFPRLTGENDQSFITRIIQNIIAPNVTIAAIQRIVSDYYKLQFQTTLPTKPTAVVFDQMSDSAQSALYNIKSPQFGISVTFPTPAGTGWYLGLKHLGVDTILINTNNFTTATLSDPVLEAIVKQAKAEGTQPVYLQSRSR